MNFKEWYENEGNGDFKYNEKYTLDDLKAAWDAAIKSADQIVSERYDYQEPWLEPGEITKSLIT